MSDPGHLLAVYLHLARASGQRNRPLVRDRLLLLAGAVAARMAIDPVAGYCRHLVLTHNPNHLIRRWPTYRQALASGDFRSFLAQLERRYPQEKAERLLQSLGIELAAERDSYFSDYEYAASLLGTTPEALDQMFPAA
ncbi:MAG: hypothetical protein FJ276_37830 [Planctomycetes bacterium]|nr:hypothetical protein [Planctomycetota bacterium]